MEKVLKIFSYLPNPRVWKAVIAGNICEVSVEVIGDKPKQLGKWLWDSNPRELEEEEMSETVLISELVKEDFQGALI